MHHLSSSVAMNVIKCKDLPFKKPEFPLLSTRCMEVIANNFSQFPKLEEVSMFDKFWIYDQLDLEREEKIPGDPESLDMKYSIVLLANYVSYDKFWQMACKKHYKILNLDKEDSTFKSIYLSNYLQRYLETMTDFDNSEGELNTILDSIFEFVKNLTVLEIRKEIDLQNLCSKLKKLEKLSLTLGRKKAGMDFERKFVGMKITDINMLSGTLCSLNNLTYLNLNGNQLDDLHIKILAEKIEEHKALTHLILSHNKISNEGAMCVSRLVLSNSVISYIDLSNNQIGYEGARSLSLVLSKTSSLDTLNLKLNYISDKACIKFFEDIQENTTLRTLDLSANLLTDECIGSIIGCINNGVSCLRNLYLVCSKFTDDSFNHLLTALSRNKTLNIFDISRSEMTKSNETRLIEIIIKKNLERKGVTFISKKQLLEYQKKDDEPEPEKKAVATKINKPNGEKEQVKEEDNEKGGDENTNEKAGKE